MNSLHELSPVGLGPELSSNTVPHAAEVAIIGGGISGLCTAALLTHHGMHVHVLEQSSRIGGYFSALTDGERIFDLAASYLLSCGADGEFSKLLRELGIDHDFHFKRLEFMDFFHFPDGSEYTIPANIDQFERELIELFPHESEPISSLFSWMKEFDSGLMSTEKKGGAFGLPPRIVLSNFLKDYQPFLESRIKDPKLRAILAVRTHADPSSLMIMAGFLNECFIRGMYYPMGGSYLLAAKLARYIISKGGSLSVSTPVSAISRTVDQQHTYCIKTTAGDELKCRTIVSSIAPFQMVVLLESNADESLKKDLDQWRSKFSHRPIGHSSFNIYLSVKNLELGHLNCGRMYVMPDQILEEGMFELYTRIERGDLVLDTILKVHCPSVHDTSLVPAGESIIRIETDMLPLPFSAFREAVLLGQEPEGYQLLRRTISDHFIARVESCLLPGLRQAITKEYVITPLDWELLTGNHQGSGTGWAHTVQNYIKSAFPTKAPLPHMYTVGQWGELGTGLRQGVMTARRATAEILKEKP